MHNNKAIWMNPYLCFGVLYCFFNSLFLPEGLLYTTLLTPLFFYMLFVYRQFQSFTGITIVIILFFCIHYWQGVNGLFYIKSLILFLSAIVFGLAAYGAFMKIKSPDTLFRPMIYINALLLIPALISLLSGWALTFFWYLEPLSPGLPVIPRLSMMTYEASYYSLLISPLVLYAIWSYLLKHGRQRTILLIAVLIPLFLSFSLGVMTGLFLSLMFTFLMSRQLMKNNRGARMIALGIPLALVLTIVVLYTWFPDNPLVLRLNNIMAGKDTSARGRTYEAFDLALRIAETKSIWFGIGLGQIKESARLLIIHYYNYTVIPEVVRIPNAVAEMLAIYGIAGLIIRFLLQIFLFFKTKVYGNYFRLSLFLFIFIYQFTGSFIFNIAEYVIWALAFSNILPVFNKKQASEI